MAHAPAAVTATTASVPVPVAPGKPVQLGTRMIPQYAGLTLRGNLYGTDQSGEPRGRHFADHDQIDRSLSAMARMLPRSVWGISPARTALVTLTVANIPPRAIPFLTTGDDLRHGNRRHQTDAIRLNPGATLRDVSGSGEGSSHVPLHYSTLDWKAPGD